MEMDITGPTGWKFI